MRSLRSGVVLGVLLLVACDHAAPFTADLSAPDLAVFVDPDLGAADLTMPVEDLAIVTDDLALADLPEVADLTPVVDLVTPPDLTTLISCGGPIVSLASDPMNCGSCNHVCGCGSTTCVSGVCEPLVLASGQSAPSAIALDGTTLYWSTETNQSLWTIATSGGTPVANRTGVSSIRGIVFDATMIYLTRALANQVMTGLKDGSGSLSNFSGQIEQGATGIALASGKLYWANFGNGSEGGAVRVGPIGNGLTTGNLVAEQNGAERVANDGTFLYWTSRTAGTIARYPLVPDSSSTVTTIVSAQAVPFDVQVDATHVYWVNRGDGTVRRRAKDGTGPIDTLAAGQTAASQLVIDATHVYFTDFAAGAIRRVPLAGGEAPTNLAINLANPLTLAQDATCLYATLQAGNVAAAGSVIKVGKQ